MSRQINTENIIKQKFDEREFAFDEGAWAEAEAMIAAQQPAGNKRILWILSILLFLGLLTGGGVWLGMQNKPQGNGPVANNQVATPATNEKPQAATTSSQGNSTASIENEEATQTAATTQSTNASSELAMATNKTSKAATSSKPAAKPAGKKATNVSSTKTNSNSSPSANTNTLDNATAQNPVSGSKSSKNSSVDDGKTTTDNGDDFSWNPQDSANETPSAKKEEGTITPAKTEENLAANTTNGTGNSYTSAGSTKDTEVLIGEAPEEVEEVKVDLDSLPEKAKPKKQKPILPGLFTRNSWHIIGGLGVWNNYSSTLGKSSVNGILGPVVGVGYEVSFNKQVAAGINVLYMSRGALNHRRVFNYTSYELGYSETTQTILEATQLHFAAVPLYARFSITNKHHLIGGVTYAQVIGTSFTKRRIIQVGADKSEEGAQKIFAKHDAFKQFDIMPFIGYEVSLSDRMKLSTIANFGINDMTNDNFKSDGEFGNDPKTAETFDRNLGVQVTLKYDLFKH